LLILSYIVGGSVSSDKSIFTKTLLPSGTSGGRCMDGSPAGFYYDKPTSQNSTLWAFFMQGGGSCHTKTDCTKRSKGHLGSSLKWPDTYEIGGLMSGVPAQNPDFYDSHRVYIPYCTGDAHSGQRLTATQETWGFYFSGHVSFAKIIDYLLADQNFGPALKKAEQVILGGESAGATGVFANIDYLADTLSWATVKGAPKAGWFNPGYAEDQPNHPELPPSDWPHWSTGQTGTTNLSGVELWDLLLHPGCVKAFPANERWLCQSVHNSYPFIKSPLIVFENQYDKHQITKGGLLPASQLHTTKGHEYIAYFGRSMRNSTERKMALKPEDGLFLDSCFQHGGLGIGSNTTIRGINQTFLLGDWFFQRGHFDSHQIIDDCVMKNPGLPCNPTCPGV